MHQHKHITREEWFDLFELIDAQNTEHSDGVFLVNFINLNPQETEEATICIGESSGGGGDVPGEAGDGGSEEEGDGEEVQTDLQTPPQQAPQLPRLGERDSGQEDPGLVERL